MNMFINLLSFVALMSATPTAMGGSLDAPANSHELPTLIGTYGASSESLEASNFAQKLFSIEPNTVTIRIRGSANFGLRRCDDREPKDLEVFEFSAVLSDTVSGHHWIAFMQFDSSTLESNGVYESTGMFYPLGEESSFADLNIDAMRILFGGGIIAGLNCEDLAPYSSAEVHGAWLSVGQNESELPPTTEVK